MPALLAFLTWLSANFHVIGWTGLTIGVWKVSRFITKAESRVLTAEQQLNTLATNHFPHMEASLKNQDGLMHEMNESLKLIATNTCKKKSK